MRRSVTLLSRSALFAVRSLSAKALVPLIPRHRLLETACDLVAGLAGSRAELLEQQRRQQGREREARHIGFNQLHGQLLQIQLLLDSAGDAINR